MNALTPPKHKTPNYRLVRHRKVVQHFLTDRPQVVQWDAWEKQPLRATRKDLQGGAL